MGKGAFFVVVYSLVLIGLFIAFSYLITTVEPTKVTRQTTQTTKSSEEERSSTDATTTLTVGFRRGPTYKKYLDKDTIYVTKENINTDIKHRIKVDGPVIISPSSTKAIDRIRKESALYNVHGPIMVTSPNKDSTKVPVKHDLNELGHKIKRILPPVHPAVKGFRRSVDDVGIRLTNKNEILLKIVDEEGIPRLEIKLKATNESSIAQNPVVKLNKTETKNDKFNLYVQVDNETPLNVLEPVEPSGFKMSTTEHTPNDQSSEIPVTIQNDNDHTNNEVTHIINSSTDALFTSGDESTATSFDGTPPTTQELHTDSTYQITDLSNQTFVPNENTVDSKTETVQSNAPSTSFADEYLTTQNYETNTNTLSQSDQVLENIDKYRKLYAESFYQRDKSEPNVPVDSSLVTSDFLLHFLPLVVPHALPRSVNIKNLMNDSEFKNFFEEYNKRINTSTINTTETKDFNSTSDQQQPAYGKSNNDYSQTLNESPIDMLSNKNEKLDPITNENTKNTRLNVNESSKMKRYNKNIVANGGKSSLISLTKGKVNDSYKTSENTYGVTPKLVNVNLHGSNKTLPQVQTTVTRNLQTSRNKEDLSVKRFSDKEIYPIF